jgi:hypothetical protein
MARFVPCKPLPRMLHRHSRIVEFNFDADRAQTQIACMASLRPGYCCSMCYVYDDAVQLLCSRGHLTLDASRPVKVTPWKLRV